MTVFDRLLRFLRDGLLSRSDETVIFYFGRGVDERLSILFQSEQLILSVVQMDAGFRFPVNKDDVDKAVLALIEFAEQRVDKICLFEHPDRRHSVTLHRDKSGAIISWPEIDYRFRYKVTIPDCVVAIERLKIT